MPTILDRIETEIAADEQRSYDEYLALVRSFVNDEEPDESRVPELLRKTNRTIADLRKGVALLEQRRAWRAQAAAGAEADASRQEAQETIVRLDAGLKAAQEHHAAEVQQQRLKIESALHLKGIANEARQQLQNPSNAIDHRLRDRLLSLRRSIKSVEESMRRLTESSWDRQQSAVMSGQLSDYRRQESQLVAELLNS